jgi:hypothetical protein
MGSNVWSPAAAGILLLVACGSTSNAGGTGADAAVDGMTSGSDGGADAAPSVDSSSTADSGLPTTDAAQDGASPRDAQPDAPSEAGADAGLDAGPACAPPTGTTFATSQLLFGDGSNGQWKSLGFDIDGQTWTSGSTTHCQPNSGATPGTAFANGNNGIDNSFGHNLLPIIVSIDPTFVTDANGGLTNGTFSLLLKMYCLPPMGNVSPMLTKLFDATPLGSTPKWDGTDAWPVAPELLINPTNPESSAISYPNSSVTGSVFDTGPNQSFVLMLPMNLNGKAFTMKLNVFAARVTMTLAADRQSTTGGVVGGVLNTEDFVTQVSELGSALGLCGQTVLNNVITTVRQASDIMSDGTQDPNQTCNGISIGLGLDMTLAQLGVVGPAAATQMACP